METGISKETIAFRVVSFDFLNFWIRNFTMLCSHRKFSFADHDDRGSGAGGGGGDRSSFKPSEIKRRVSFKNTVRNYKSVNDMKVKAFLEDEDMAGELASGESSQARLSGEFRRGGSNFRNRRKGSPIPRNVGGSGKLLQSPTGWYQVTIHHGAKYDKDIILKLLLNAVSPSVFIPNYYKVDNDSKNAVFFVDEHDVAEKILRLDRKLELPDGFKMLLRVRGSMPQTRIDESLKERMKNAMVKRYNQATKALDLTKFHADPELTDIFCALFRPPIMSAAIDIIAENIPDLEALNLNDNKLNLLEHMKVMTSKLPNLKILYLGNNKIFMMNSLDAFRGLPLVELFLEGNPCKKRIRDNAHYVRYLVFSSAPSDGVT